MGEIADMMLDGTLCEQCGVYIGKPCEFPRLCAACAMDLKKQGHKIRGTGMGGFQDLGKPQSKKKKK